MPPRWWLSLLCIWAGPEFCCILITLGSLLISNVYRVRLGISLKFLHWQLQKSHAFQPNFLGTGNCTLFSRLPWDFHLFREPFPPCCSVLDDCPGHLQWVFCPCSYHDPSFWLALTFYLSVRILCTSGVFLSAWPLCLIQAFASSALFSTLPSSWPSPYCQCVLSKGAKEK